MCQVKQNDSWLKNIEVTRVVRNIGQQSKNEHKTECKQETVLTTYRSYMYSLVTLV